MRKIKQLTVIIFCFLILFVLGCNKKDNQSGSDDLTKKELDLKEKELQLKEKELEQHKQVVNKTDSVLNIEIKPPVISAFFISKNKQESANLIDNKDFNLFNVIIGEGSYKNNNLPEGNSVRIKVEIFSNAEANYEISVKEEIEISGKSKFKIRKIIADKINANENKSKIIEFIINDIGCSPLIISAAAFSGSKRKETVKTINFFCGE
jgi:hypothetical protein